MEKFRKLKSKVTPVAINDVDTDMIIPAQYLTSISRDGYGENLFRRLRDEISDFSLNKSEFSGSKILVSGSNFGCGSSREHAVWAIMGYGFRVVIAKSFADIFFGNSAKSGLLLITLEEKLVDSLLEKAKTGNLELEVDLEKQEVVLGDGSKVSFDYDPFRRHCLLEGLDDIDYIFSNSEKIKEFRSKQANFN